MSLFSFLLLSLMFLGMMLPVLMHCTVYLTSFRSKECKRYVHRDTSSCPRKSTSVISSFLHSVSEVGSRCLWSRHVRIQRWRLHWRFSHCFRTNWTDFISLFPSTPTWLISNGAIFYLSINFKTSKLLVYFSLRLGVLSLSNFYCTIGVVDWCLLVTGIKIIAVEYK